jgi:hypothetical protein
MCKQQDLLELELTLLCCRRRQYSSGACRRRGYFTGCSIAHLGARLDCCWVRAGDNEQTQWRGSGREFQWRGSGQEGKARWPTLLLLQLSCQAGGFEARRIQRARRQTPMARKWTERTAPVARECQEVMSAGL